MTFAGQIPVTLNGKTSSMDYLAQFELCDEFWWEDIPGRYCLLLTPSCGNKASGGCIFLYILTACNAPQYEFTLYFSSPGGEWDCSLECNTPATLTLSGNDNSALAIKIPNLNIPSFKKIADQPPMNYPLKIGDLCVI
jgi:hypothetical protein